MKTTVGIELISEIKGALNTYGMIENDVDRVVLANGNVKLTWPAFINFAETTPEPIHDIRILGDGWTIVRNETGQWRMKLNEPEIQRDPSEE